MSRKSTIEWTNSTWNPVTGCTKVSAGCDHCYAERLSERFEASRAILLRQVLISRFVPNALSNPGTGGVRNSSLSIR